MDDNILKKIINDLIEALFCYDAFPFPISAEYPDIHITSKVNIIEMEIDGFKEKINKLYGLNTFIPIIPEKGSEIYKCQYEKIYGNITKLSELIYYIKSLHINLDINTLENILEREVDPNMEINKDDIEKFNKRMNLFDFLVIKSQREQYIKELNRRQHEIDFLHKKINTETDLLKEIKSKPSYNLLSSKNAAEIILREQFKKKITIFLIAFEKDLNKIVLSKEIILLKKRKFNWFKFTDQDIEKMIDYICIVFKDKLILIYDGRYDVLLKKLKTVKELIIKLIS